MIRLPIHRHNNNKYAILRELATITQNDITDIADSKPVDHNHAGLHTTNNLPLLLCKLEDLSVLTDEDIFLRHPKFTCQICMLYEMMVLAMHRHKEFRTYKIVHQLEFFTAAVP